MRNILVKYVYRRIFQIRSPADNSISELNHAKNLDEVDVREIISMRKFIPLS